MWGSTLQLLLVLAWCLEYNFVENGRGIYSALKLWNYHFGLNVYQDIVLENENWISDITQYQFVSKITIWPSQKILWFVIYLKFRGVWFVVSLKGKECNFNKPAFSANVCPTKSWQYLQTVLIFDCLNICKVKETAVTWGCWFGYTHIMKVL